MAQEMDISHRDIEGAAVDRVKSQAKRDEQVLSRNTPGYYRRAWRRLCRDKVAMTGLAMVILIVAFSVGADFVSEYVTGHEYTTISLTNQFSPPFQGDHILGTDSTGRDILTRLAYGGRVSLTVAALAVLGVIVIGSTVGASAGYFGGAIDTVLMRLVDVLLTIPGLSLLILVSALYRPNYVELAILIAAIGWAGVARLIRGEVLSLRSRDFIEAARVIGSSNARIIFRHVMPNVVPLIVVYITLAVPGYILAEAALSFLGLGVQIPTPSWGNMLTNARDYYSRSWSGVFIPGMMIWLTVLSIGLLGKGLRDALDPRLNE